MKGRAWPAFRGLDRLPVRDLPCLLAVSEQAVLQCVCGAGRRAHMCLVVRAIPFDAVVMSESLCYGTQHGMLCAVPALLPCSPSLEGAATCFGASCRRAFLQ